MKLSLIHILIFSSFLLLFNSGKWGVLETSEARYAEISREMLVDNDYIHPSLLEIHHYHKPPITYYITSLGFKIFGVNAFGARFFLQIAILIQLILIYKIALLLFNNKSLALTAVLIYFSLPLILISSRNLTTDAYLNTFILASVYFWLTYKIKYHKPYILYLFYLFLGLIFETKGPVGLIFPLFFIIAYKLIYKEKIERNIHQLLGVILFLIISMVWYIVLILDKPELWDYFINHQLKDRMVSNSFNRSKPFWYYLLTIPLLTLPWFIIIIAHLKSTFYKILKERQITLVLYAVIFAIMFLFSAFETKLIFYVMPMLGFLAILSAKILVETSKKSLLVYNKVIICIGVLFLISILIINTIGLEFYFNFIHAVLLSFTAIIAFFLISKFQSGHIKTAALSYTFGATLLLAGNGVLAQNEDLLNSTKPATAFIDSNLKHIDNILVYDYLMPSVKFNSNKTVITLNNGHNTVERETQFETDMNWKDHLLDLKTESGRKKTDSLLQHKSVLISRKKESLPDFLEYLNHAPFTKKEFGNWVIYY